MSDIEYSVIMSDVMKSFDCIIIHSGWSLALIFMKEMINQGNNKYFHDELRNILRFFLLITASW